MQLNLNIYLLYVLHYNKYNSIIVPHYLGIFLQGFQEGDCITTIGLYFGDRIFNSVGLFSGA